MSSIGCIGMFARRLQSLCFYSLRLPVRIKRNFGKRKVLANNSVSKIEEPEGVNCGDGIDYNPVLNLFVTMECGSGKVIFDNRSLGIDDSLYTCCCCLAILLH